MFITMHCGGLPFNGDTIKEKSLGGSETAAYYLAKDLSAKGHKVTLFTNSQDEGVFDGVKYVWAGEFTDAMPLGERFTFYAENTPHDVCIIQRHPHAFSRKYASKINLLWLHDLAMQRNKAAMLSQSWNIDGFLTVSQFHKNQIVTEWGLNPDFVYPITNGIDLSLFKPQDRDRKTLVYSSRPERGLENLVKPGGIMDQLQGTDYVLAVCGYENTTPQMADYYDYLWDRCDQLPNVKNLGPLTKSELADLMASSGALIYPTTFEEVSCITAMEAMAAGLPFVSSAHAALPETCKDSGSHLIPLIDGEADLSAFVEFFASGHHEAMFDAMSAQQQAAARRYTWDKVAGQVEDICKGIFSKSSKTALLNHFIRNSDIVAADIVMQGSSNDLDLALIDECNKAYAFYHNNTFAEHYKAYYEYEKNRGVEYGPEDVTGNSRFRAVAGVIASLPAGLTVLDYGCAHGHYTVALAKLFPKLQFKGIDLTQSNIDKAKAWAELEGLTNISFEIGNATMYPIAGKYDAIIAAEVIEHVAEPQKLVDTLASSLNEGGVMVITTPYGPWEAQGYEQHTYWRAHLHHFERSDIHEAFGHHPQFNVLAAPSGNSKFGSSIGSYIYTFKKPIEASREINYVRKIDETMADNTLSVCMIVKDAESDIVRCLRSIVSYANEIIIAVDRNTKDRTLEEIAAFQKDYPLVRWDVFMGDPASEIGFAEARNITIERASGDWVMWIDSDEVLHGAENLYRIMRNNQFNGYAVNQHHMSVEPVGLLKTDLPVRLFRNRIGVKFFGFVHEHPEQQMNKGLGNVCMAEGLKIMHYGYTDEPVRRGRFVRNIGLLDRDRKENPDRVLGKFLWLRDLAQMCQYDIESGNANPQVFRARADEGIKLWSDLLNDGQTRLAVDGLQFYSDLVRLTHNGFDFGFSVDASKMNGGLHPEKAQFVHGHFHDKELAFKLQRKLSEDRIAGFDSRYF